MTKKLMLLICLSLIILAACEPQAPAGALEEEAYIDPDGLFTIAYPLGWLYSADETAGVVTFAPAQQEDPQKPLMVKVYAAPTPSTEVNASGEEARALFETFMQANLATDYQVYSTGETDVNKLPAVVIDFGKPLEDGFAAGRIVLLYAPGYAVAFMGSSTQTQWEAFLPTFRAMLDTFQFLPQE